MEPENLLPCSQEPAIEPYPEPAEFSPHHHNLFLRFILIVYFPLWLSSSRCFYLRVFQPKHFMRFSSFPCVLRGLPISCLF